MLGLLQAVRGALWLSNTTEESPIVENKPSKKETTTLTGRVTQYDKAKCSGMVNHNIFFDKDAIMGGKRPQVSFFSVFLLLFVLSGLVAIIFLVNRVCVIVTGQFYWRYVNAWRK